MNVIISCLTITFCVFEVGGPVLLSGKISGNSEGGNDIQNNYNVMLNLFQHPTC